MEEENVRSTEEQEIVSKVIAFCKKYGLCRTTLFAPKRIYVSRANDGGREPVATIFLPGDRASVDLHAETDAVGLALKEMFL